MEAGSRGWPVMGRGPGGVTVTSLQAESRGWHESDTSLRTCLPPAQGPQPHCGRGFSLTGWCRPWKWLTSRTEKQSCVPQSPRSDCASAPPVTTLPVRTQPIRPVNY